MGSFTVILSALLIVSLIYSYHSINSEFTTLHDKISAKKVSVIKTESVDKETTCA